jgi:uncharacterized protein YkwD
MVRVRTLTRRAILASLPLVTLVTVPCASPPARAQRPAAPADSRCAPAASAPTATVQAGRPYLAIAYQALARDRARYAGLGPQRQSPALSLVAERHSDYMASIGSWSDGDPSGDVLSRVRAMGIEATYAGQNVVTANGATAAAAIEQGESFFAREANGGGPHWDNIANPNHHYVGIGIALLGSPGSYTIYLTQVFSDGGGCAAAAPDTFTPASSVTSTVRIGATVHPTVDTLQLRSAPHGMVIGTLSAHDRMHVVDLKQGWAQVKVLATNMYGWVFASFLAAG